MAEELIVPAHILATVRMIRICGYAVLTGSSITLLGFKCDENGARRLELVH